MIIKKFATRLNVAIVLIVTIIFCIMLTTFYHYMQRKLVQETLRRAEYVISMMDMQVDKVITSSEYAMGYFSSELLRNLDNKEELQRIVHNSLSLNPGYTHSIIAFRPNSHRGKGKYYSLMSNREGDDIKDYILDSDTATYLRSQWFEEPLVTGQKAWCNLHFSKEDSTLSYISLATPVIEKTGEPPVAVFMTKISLNWLVSMINENNPLPNTTNILTNGKDFGLAFSMGEDSLWHVSFHKIGDILTLDDLREDITSQTNIWNISSNMTLMDTHNTCIALQDRKCYFAFEMGMPVKGLNMLTICPAEDLLSELFQTAIIVSIIGLFGITLLFLITTRTVKRMTKPLNDLSNSARHIADGDFNSPLPVITSGDEMQELGESFHHMQTSLIHYMDELKRTTMAKQRIESELAIAHSIQMGMIPKTFPPFPDRKDVDIYAFMRPAREVGGDLYDYFIQKDKLYFIIGDVSGKGVPASLFMAVVRSLFRSVAHQKDTPSEIVSQMNRSVMDTNVYDMFVTLFVGILDLNSGELQFCDAGHNPFVLMTDTGSSFMKMRPNLPVAVMNDFPYVTESIQLKNTTMLFYTDGLTEAENEQKEFYGDERLLETASSLQGKNPTDVTREITASVETFVGKAEQSDDLTILTIRYTSEKVYPNAPNA